MADYCTACQLHPYRARWWISITASTDGRPTIVRFCSRRCLARWWVRVGMAALPENSKES
jgi:hypothetical protein